MSKVSNNQSLVNNMEVIKELEKEIELCELTCLKTLEFEGKTIGVGYARFLKTYYETKEKLNTRKRQ